MIQTRAGAALVRNSLDQVQTHEDQSVVCFQEVVLLEASSVPISNENILEVTAKLTEFS